MVLQSLVLSVLKGYLGEFLHDLDNDKLQLELWNGEVELKDCELNPSALDKYDPPVGLEPVAHHQVGEAPQRSRIRVDVVAPVPLGRAGAEAVVLRV